VRVCALLAGVKLELVAAGSAGKFDEAPHQLTPDACAASDSRNEDVLNNCPRLAVMGQVGDDQKISGPDEMTVDGRDHQVPSPISDDLFENRLRIAQISRCRGASVLGEFVLEAQEAVEIR
jgi:hypothetical protein